MNKFEAALERLKKVFPDESWTEEDYAYFKTLEEALEMCAEKEVIR